MTLTLSRQTRIVVLLGAASALALLAFWLLVLRQSGDPALEAAGTGRLGEAVTRTARTTKAKAATPTRPRVVLRPGLPAPIARELRRSRVLVVSLYGARAAIDGEAVAQARSGAGAVGAAFLAVDVFDERAARPLAAFAGRAAPPAVLVVRRPGEIVTRIDGYADREIVAQAAHNALSGR
jgi:hypothetical protein